MQSTVTEQSTLDELRPLLLDAVQVASLLSVSKDTIRRMNASGKIPTPIKISKGTVCWRYKELQDWSAAGCPERNTWEVIRCHDGQKSAN